MAKKQTKQAAPVAPVVAFVSALVGILTAQAKSADAYSTENKSRSAAVVALISDFWSSFKGDSKGYLVAVADALGNGERGKANVPGKVADALKAAGVTALCVRTTLSHARTVAMSYARADVRKAASESGLRAGYDAAKPPKADSDKPTSAHAVAGVAKPISPAEVVALIIREQGIGTLLAMAESALSAMKDPIRAGMIHEARAKIA